MSTGFACSLRSSKERWRILEELRERKTEARPEKGYCSCDYHSRKFCGPKAHSVIVVRIYFVLTRLVSSPHFIVDGHFVLKISTFRYTGTITSGTPAAAGFKLVLQSEDISSAHASSISPMPMPYYPKVEEPRGIREVLQALLGGSSGRIGGFGFPPPGPSYFNHKGSFSAGIAIRLELAISSRNNNR